MMALCVHAAGFFAFFFFGRLEGDSAGEGSRRLRLCILDGHELDAKETRGRKYSTRRQQEIQPRVEKKGERKVSREAVKERLGSGGAKPLACIPPRYKNDRGQRSYAAG